MSGASHVGLATTLGPRRKPRQNRLKATPFRSIASALALTPNGETFYLQQTAGTGVYEYTKTGPTTYTFTGMQPWSSRLRQATDPGSSDANLPALPAAVTHFWDATTAKLWDGRVVLNVVSTVSPTLNLVPDPFVMVNENGTNVPARSGFDATIVDPLGNHQAMILGYTSQLQALNYATSASITGLPIDNYVSQVQFKQADATTGSLRIGMAANGASAATLAATGSWQSLTFTNTAVDLSTITLAITNPLAGGAWNAAVYNLQMYDTKAGTSLPDNTTELAAAAASHLKAPLAYPGSVPLDVNGWLKFSGAGGIDNMLACFQQLNVTELTIGGVVDASTAIGGPTLANLISVAAQQQSGVTPGNKGQIGIDSAFHLYCNPSLAAAARSTDILQSQGPVSLILCCKPGHVTAFINGVPVFDDTTSGTALAWSSFLLERLMIGANSSNQKRDQQTNKLTDPINFPFFAPAFLSDSDVIAVHKHMCARARRSGKRMGAHKALVIGCGDSLTAFGGAPFWKMNSAASLKPGIHTALDAIGGSKYVIGAASGSNSYNDPIRQALRRRMMVAGLAAGYEQVVVHWQYGHNDISGGVMDSPNTVDQGAAIIDAMIFADKAAADDGTGRLKTYLVTNPADSSATAARIARLNDYNSRSITPGDPLYYVTRGYDAVIPLHQYIPPGWPSLDAASLDAFTTGVDNDVYLGGGLHWSDTGGVNAAAAVFTPFYQALAATLTGLV